MFDYKIHITPDDYIHELEEKDCKDYLFIAPVGETLNNEMSDVYYQENAFVPYHEHKKGYETFAIDRGSVEVTINGKRAIAETGDMIHIEPYMSHGFRFLEEGTIWRELFSGMNMYGGILEKQLIDRSYPEKLQDDAFMAEYRLKHHTMRLGEPEPEVVPKEQLAQIRPKGGSIARFVFDGIVCNQKVGRHETGGEKEVWEFVMEKGICVEWDSPHLDWDLYVVKEGRVEVTVLGGTFVANARDILHFPPYTNYSMKILDHGTVVHAYNVKALGLRLAEIVEKKLEGRQDLVNNWEDVREIFRQNNSCITKISRV
ncbi:cupin domain-containing protein [Enterocloster citroniae]|uniref:cupin domain-containing protein n=1 Tax=Enterocloster citroniae TaxID=358743 RepID=UPI00349E601C